MLAKLTFTTKRAVKMSQQIEFPYARQSISKEDIQAVTRALEGSFITRGPLVQEFEERLASYCGAKYAVAFNSGSTALMAAYFAADIHAGDSLLTSPNTFIATAGAAMQRGAVPIFIDIERSTGNLNLEQLFYNMNRPSVSRKTIVAPVHFAGIPVDLEEIYKKVGDLRTLIIEDGCHALGSKYKDGSPVGSCRWSDMTVLSFHPAKTITTGEGGAVTTNDAEMQHSLQLFRNNGLERDPNYLQREEEGPWYYEGVALSGNFNFTEIQAALGLSQLKRIDSFIEKRRRLLALYEEKLKNCEHLKLFTPHPKLFVAPHLCVVQIDFAAFKTTRLEVMQRLREKGIGSQVHYIPLYKHPCFGSLMQDLEPYFPETESYYAQALSLPLYYDLNEAQVEMIAEQLKQILRI